jgi:transcriptional regulator with XRE-family HTH domain
LYKGLLGLYIHIVRKIIIRLTLELSKLETNLGELLKKLRGKMSLREVANISGLSHTYIRDLELGINRSTKTKIQPSPETLNRLALAYSSSYDELMRCAGYVHDDYAEVSTNNITNNSKNESQDDLLVLLNSNTSVTVGGYKLSEIDIKKV